MFSIDTHRGSRTVAAIRRHKLLKLDIARLSGYDISYPSTLFNFRLQAEAEIFS